MPPDPASEIRLTNLAAIRGANYWARRSVVRMDLKLGAFDEISSADVPGFSQSLARALPGLAEHECSIGAPGGFLLRLQRGTYAAHIVEHVAIELQVRVGHTVGYGRSRGGDEAGEYTVVFDYCHERVGLRAATLALELVHRAFAGSLDSAEPAVEELAALAATPDLAPGLPAIFCGITGSTGSSQLCSVLRARFESLYPGLRVLHATPASILRQGLPYSSSEMAIVLDTDPGDVPSRYRVRERAVRLVSVLADAVRPGGTLICPAPEHEIRTYASERGCRIATFETDPAKAWRERGAEFKRAVVSRGRVVIEGPGGEHASDPLVSSIPAAVQAAALLAEHITRAEPVHAGES